MKKTRIALLQIYPELGNRQGNADTIQYFLKQAAMENADLAVFPECSLTGYSTKKARQIAVTADDDSIEQIRNCGRELKMAVCFGYVEKTGSSYYITQELFADGRTVLYRKTHLGSKEREIFTEGNEFPVLCAPISAGMQLCFESHIPEISTVERKKGAELLLVPYASPMSREKCLENWSVHLPARASDNGCFLAACNLLFPEKDGKSELNGGGLAVFDPKGRRIAEYFETEEHMLICDLEGPLPRELPDGDMHNISYFDRKRKELFEDPSDKKP